MSDLAQRVYEAFQEFRLAGFTEAQAFSLSQTFLASWVATTVERQAA